MSDIYPRKPTDEEKKDLAEICLPEKSFKDVDFTDVWLLAPLFNSELVWNCFGWSILTPQTISIPAKLDNLNYLAAHATEKYHVSPYDYIPVTSEEDPKAIRVWGEAKDDIGHVSRICNQALLQKYAHDFDLKLSFGGSSTADFPAEIWSSKLGDRQGFITHPINWLEGGVWGDKVEDLKIKT